MKSRGPRIAIIAAVAVLVLGIGGYAAVAQQRDSMVEQMTGRTYDSMEELEAAADDTSPLEWYERPYDSNRNGELSREERDAMPPYGYSKLDADVRMIDRAERFTMMYLECLNQLPTPPHRADRLILSMPDLSAPRHSGLTRIILTTKS